LTSWLGSLTTTLLPFVTQAAQVRVRVRFIPASVRAETEKPLGRTLRTLRQDDRVVRDKDVEPVASLDAEPAACVTRHDDLVLGTDFHT
jgi:hypothetical protein